MGVRHPAAGRRRDGLLRSVRRWTRRTRDPPPKGDRQAGYVRIMSSESARLPGHDRRAGGDLLRRQRCRGDARVREWRWRGRRPRRGVIPSTAARTMSEAAVRGGFDIAAIARGRAHGCHARHSAGQGTARARSSSIDPASATYVHWGATSQDVTDTALVLLLEQARSADRRRSRTARPCAARAVGTARGHGDAGAHAAAAGHADHVRPQGRRVDRRPSSHSWRRLHARGHARWSSSLAAPPGTLRRSTIRASGRSTETARELDLRAGAAVAHRSRSSRRAGDASCGLYVAALGKVARDITLLMQAEVGEAAEPGGGSSTMPHKRNPSGCTLVLAAATRMPGLVASYLTAMSQEHERGVGGIQAEWPIVGAAVQSTGAAVAALADGDRRARPSTRRGCGRTSTPPAASSTPSGP